MRYKAMVVTRRSKKRYWHGPLYLMDRCFAVWDYAASEWWRGETGGRVSFKYYASAVERAKTLNEGTYVSQYMAKDRGQIAYARLLDPDREPACHWFIMPSEVIVEPQPWRPELGPRIKDDAHAFLSGYYRDEQYEKAAEKWVNVPHPRHGWGIEIKLASLDGGDEEVTDKRITSLPEWIKNREELHARLLGDPHGLMEDITDRGWLPEGSPADKWRYEVTIWE